MPGGRAYDAMTCDLRVAELWQGESVAAKRYAARLESATLSVRARRGDRLLLSVLVGNRGDTAWRRETPDKFRLGIQLRTPSGRLLRELPGAPLPPGSRAPGSADTVLVDMELPRDTGDYELLVDVVEEGVCWFSERGSIPLFVELHVLAETAAPWDPGPLVDDAYLTLTGQAADLPGRAFWTQKLREEMPFRDFVESFRRRLGDDAFEERRERLTEALGRWTASR